MVEKWFGEFRWTWEMFCIGMVLFKWGSGQVDITLVLDPRYPIYGSWVNLRTVGQVRGSL